MINLDLSKIKDSYTRAVFRQLSDSFTKIVSNIKSTPGPQGPQGEAGNDAVVNIGTFVRTLDSSDISNGYITVPAHIIQTISVTPEGWPPQFPLVDFTTTVIGPAESRVSMIGDMASLVIGDKVSIVYCHN
jgi:hypothetical protein